MPVPEYRYGKVSGLLPDLTVVSERSESPMVCCGYCSAQMAARTAKAGLSTLMANEAHKMRAAAGRPHNAGNTASELRNGARAALGVTLQDVDVANIPARLRAGFAVTVGLQYGQLPAWLKVQTNDFGHAVCLFGWDELEDHVGFFDPLWTQGARGAWVPWSSLANAIWPNKNHSTTVVKLGGGDSMAGIYFNPTRWKANKDIPVYLDPSWAVQVSKFTAGSEFTCLGPRAKQDADGFDSTARAVRLITGGLIPGTGEAGKNAILWAKGADFANATGIATVQAWDDSIWALMGQPDGRYPCPPPVVTPPEPGPDCNEQVLQAVMQRDEEWETALRHGDAWPTEP